MMHVKSILVFCLVLFLTREVVGQFCDNTTTATYDDKSVVMTIQDDTRSIAPHAGDHDLLLGNCDGLSSLFYDEVRCFEPVFNETIYTIKQYRFSFAGASIHCVNVTDLVPSGGGYPARYEGGIGRDFIDIRFMTNADRYEGGIARDFIDILFMSQPSQGMEFRVKVYARSGIAGNDQRV